MIIFKNNFLIIIQALCVSVIGIQAFNTTTISNIHTAILTDYDIDVRPASLTDVHIQFNLLHINELSIRTQTLSTSGWFTISWTDTRLTWNPSNYGNVDIIYLKETKIWKPELIVDNVVTAISPLAGNNLLIQVKHDGTMHWDPPGMYNTHCSIDVTYFPYDKQTCTIELTSWSYTIASVKLAPEITQINTADFYENGEWDVKQTFVTSKQLVENGDTYDQLVFSITMKRKPAYYLQTVIFPVILIFVLTIVVFLLPAESGEKISFGLTVLLSLAVLLTLISDKLPTTAVHTSILSVYLTATLALSTMSIVLSVLIVRLHHQLPQDKVPHWMKTITNVILVPCFQKRSASVECIDEIDKNNVGLQNEEKKEKVSNVWNDEEKDSKKEESFHFVCRDVAYMLDKFFLIVFLVLTVIATILFLFVLAFGAG